MADIGGGIRLPSFSFKEYVNTIVIDVNEPEELPFIIMNIIENIIEIKNKDTIVLLNIIISSNSQFEIRIWINPMKNEAIIMHNIAGDAFDLNQVYKVAIEEFRATETAASLDHEIAGSMGIKLTRVDLSMLPSILHSILKIDEATSRGRGMDKAGGSGTPGRSEMEPSIMHGEPGGVDVISLCLDRVWQVCGRMDCMEAGRDPIEMVSRHGVAVVGREGEYVCVLRGWESCSFVVSMFKKDLIESVCMDSLDGVKKFLEDISAKGYVNVLL
ncbi:MAG: hypothetical protein GSR84_02455 [Desulfurococcales archaeon]|nr:hypothetical protein [Desulfurococcales archaeon]